MASIKQLAERKAKLLADLAKVNAEIKARHGEIDNDSIDVTTIEMQEAKEGDRSDLRPRGKRKAE